MFLIWQNDKMTICHMTEWHKVIFWGQMTMSYANTDVFSTWNTTVDSWQHVGESSGSTKLTKMLELPNKSFGKPITPLKAQTPVKSVPSGSTSLST